MTHGKFYLRYGFIDENLYYQYIVQLDNGGFVSNKINYNQVILNYDTDNYRVEQYIFHIKAIKELQNNLMKPLLCIDTIYQRISNSCVYHEFNGCQSYYETAKQILAGLMIK